MKTPLAGIAGKEANVVLFDVGPGWKLDNHFHYQDLALCDNLTAAANVFLGREIRRKMGPFKYLNYPAMYRRAGELFNGLCQVN